MNKIKLSFLTSLLFLSITGLRSQTIMDKLFERYNGKDGYTTINISSEMFKLFANMEDKDGRKNEATELINAASKLTGIKAITVNTDSTDLSLSKRRAIDLYNEVKPLIGPAYTMLMEVKDNKENVLVYTRRSGKIISEVIVLVKEPNSTVFLCITGDVDLEQIGRLASRMNIHAAKKLNKIKKH